MKPAYTRLSLAALTLAMSLSAGAVAAEVAAVVSPRSGVTALTPAQIADIYLGRSSRFPDGSPAVPCDLPESHPLREAFYTRVLGKSPSQVKAHWAKIIFTGRGHPPREVSSIDEAKRLVAENPNMICYIDRSAADRSVQVLLTR